MPVVTVREYELVGKASLGIGNVDNGDGTYTVQFPQQTRHGLQLLWLALPNTWSVGTTASGATRLENTTMTWGSYYALLYCKYITDLNRHDCCTINGGGNPLTNLAYAWLVLNGATATPTTANCPGNVRNTGAANSLICPNQNANQNGSSALRIGVSHAITGQTITMPSGVDEIATDCPSAERFSIGLGLDDQTYDAGNGAGEITMDIQTMSSALSGYGATIQIAPGEVLTDGASGGPSIPPAGFPHHDHWRTWRSIT